MKTVTIEQANKDITSLVNYSLETHDEVTIATELGAVIVLPQDDYNSMQETLRLLMDKKSLSALLEGHQIREQGKEPNTKALEDIFSDL